MGLHAPFLLPPHRVTRCSFLRPSGQPGTQPHQDKSLLRNSPNLGVPSVARSGLQQGHPVFRDRLVTDVVGLGPCFLTQELLCKGWRFLGEVSLGQPAGGNGGPASGALGHIHTPVITAFPSLPFWWVGGQRVTRLPTRGVWAASFWQRLG